jgi:sulfatase-modifying factor enzyme 1
MAVGGASDADQVSDVGEGDLLRELASLHPIGNRDWAFRIVEAIKLRAGLLLGRSPGVYAFPHRTFQEYLAGTHLSNLAAFPEEASRRLDDGAYWHNVVLLAVGRLVYVSRNVMSPLALVGELCPVDVTDDDRSWRKARISGEALVEIGVRRVSDSELGRDLLARVRTRLRALVECGRLSAMERVAAGDALGKLGATFSNHPVTGVTWHEALAFCDWLTDQLRTSDRTPPALADLLSGRSTGGRRWRVTLPSEAEWEKAARGPAPSRRMFPWGDEPDPEAANYEDAGIRRTSPVGSFPKGHSVPYEIHDLSGNVWEWTRSIWGKDVTKPDRGDRYRPRGAVEDLKAPDDVLRVLRCPRSSMRPEDSGRRFQCHTACFSDLLPGRNDDRCRDPIFTPSCDLLI